MVAKKLKKINYAHSLGDKQFCVFCGSLRLGKSETSRRNSGFTILEVIIVLAILGIISALVVSKISINIDDTKRDEQINILKAHLRYAQARAMNSSSEWGIWFDTDDDYSTDPDPGTDYSIYWLFKDSDQNTKIRLPGEEKKVGVDDKLVTMSNLTINSIIPGGDFVAFNTLGSPVDADGTLVTIDIIIKKSGGDIIITIKANTGFIP